MALQSERDALATQLSTAQCTVDKLRLEKEELITSNEESRALQEAQGKRWRGEVEMERNGREEMEKKLKYCEERCVRLEVEGDSLRGEIR